jgi:hypothetical protein
MDTGRRKTNRSGTKLGIHWVPVAALEYLLEQMRSVVEDGWIISIQISHGTRSPIGRENTTRDDSRLTLFQLTKDMHVLAARA